MLQPDGNRAYLSSNDAYAWMLTAVTFQLAAKGRGG